MSYRALFLSVLTLALVSVGCETLKASKPIMPVRDYERMIVGRFDANYVGTDNCLSACHYHDKIRDKVGKISNSHYANTLKPLRDAGSPAMRRSAARRIFASRSE